MPLVIPDEVLQQAGLSEREALIEFACRLFDIGKLALCPAAKLAGLSRVEMEGELMKRKIPIYRPTPEDLAEEIEAHRAARIQLEGTIHELDLKKWENVRDVMKLPKSINEMTANQLIQLEDVLSQYKYGDEFLPVRLMETISNTRLAGMRSVREIVEVLAKDRGISIEEATKFKPTEFHRFMGDFMLARQHPFFERLVIEKNRGFLEANARIINLSDKANDLGFCSKLPITLAIKTPFLLNFSLANLKNS